MLATTITQLTVRALDVPMRKPFGIAGGAQAEARNALVVVELADGTRGFGEAAPFPAFNGETQAQAIRACERARDDVVGADARTWHALAERVRDACAPSRSAACAVETAIVDAGARSRGAPLRAVFGGATTSVVTDVTITTGTPDDAAREASAFAAFSTLKIKVGGGDLDRDVARVLAVRRARPDARVLLDANGGLDVEDAVRLATELRRHGVVPALFEQPVAPSWDALAEVRGRTKLTIAIDESVTRAEDVDEARRRRAADAVNVKIMKSGVAEAMAIARRAQELGLSRMIGGLVETRLAMGTSASIAAGLGAFDFVDLDTPLFLAEDPFEGGYAHDGERLDLAGVRLGHGCVPRSSR